MSKISMIFGVTGQDGSYLSELLLEKGYEVVGIKRRSSTNTTERLNGVIDNENFSLLEGDVVDPSSVNNLVRDYQPDEIYNLSAQSHVHTSFAQPLYTFQVNALGVIHILEAIRNYSPKSKVYQASTSELWGSNYNVKDNVKYQDEKTYFAPNSPYAVAKLAAHESIRLYRDAYGIFACAGILHNHECFKYDYPFIVKKDGIIDILSIYDIAILYTGFDCKDNKSGTPISNLQVWDSNGWTDVKCVSWFKNVDKAVKIINARNAVYCVSHDHKCILENGINISADQIELGNCIKSINYPNNIATDYIKIEEAELLGMLVGDGSLTNNSFTNKDKKLRKRFDYLWNIVTGGHTKYYPSTSGFTGKIVGRLDFSGGNQWLRGFVIYSNCKDVFGHKYKIIPKQILNSNVDIMEAFLVGYNNCDGLKAGSGKYRFKNFKTNSPILAAGLLYLINCVTQQKFNITIEESWKHGKQQFYYSLNLLSDKKTSLEKFNIIQSLKQKNPSISQRKIHLDTGISRSFIRKIYNGYCPANTHNWKLINNEVKKIVHINSDQYNNWFFNLETESGTLHAGIGQGVVNNSPRRGEEFVTRKITQWIGKFKKWIEVQTISNFTDYYIESNIYKGTSGTLQQLSKLRLGNIDAVRDWSHAKDMVRGMWMMLQQDKPKDYVLCSGKGHSVREFLHVAFSCIGVDDWLPYVVIDPKFYRPCEVEFLQGVYSLAKQELGWEPKIGFDELVKEMVDFDIERATSV